ncbi:MAG: hypothetical protein A3C50_02105 [Candidatus Staskawiczbacteria bacterium RIFCSPHIGHO2_02_FULL_43_16]|nr:MAG: hypothetical protein A3C50_02105 [Candidatus Staskawiczbacteria bacterium RIFCSPHIGHO2_02_FULL_43_16]
MVFGKIAGGVEFPLLRTIGSAQHDSTFASGLDFETNLMPRVTAITTFNGADNSLGTGTSHSQLLYEN